MFQNESFNSYEHFIKMIQNEILPSGFIFVLDINCMYFHYIKQYNGLTVAPSLLVSVFVDVNLETKVFTFSKRVPNAFYRHSLLLQTLHSTSELKNILSLCKSVCDSLKDFISSNSCLSLVVNLLELHQSSLTDHESLSLIRFVIEQLQLPLVQKHGRRYSVELITTAFLWQLTSTAFYKKIRQVLILPSSSRLRQLSAGSNVSTRRVALKYLKHQSESLSAQEKIVVLLLYEVYTAQHVEYSDGNFFGLTEDNVPAKTVLAFMVQFICEKYRDVVCVIPVNKVDTDTLSHWFKSVLKAISAYYKVLAVCADKYICNR